MSFNLKSVHGTLNVFKSSDANLFFLTLAPASGSVVQTLAGCHSETHLHSVAKHLDLAWRAEEGSTDKAYHSRKVMEEYTLIQEMRGMVIHLQYMVDLIDL